MKINKKSQMSLGMIFQVMIAFVLFSFLGVGFSLGIMSSGRESVEISDLHRIHDSVFSKLINDPGCFWLPSKGTGILYPVQITGDNMDTCLRKNELSPNYEIEVRFINPENTGDATSITPLNALNLAIGDDGRGVQFIRISSAASNSLNSGTSFSSVAPGFFLSTSSLINIWDGQSGKVQTYLMTLITKAI